MTAILPYLPFTRPTLDEETIADVAAVLRSGWITSGPKAKAFEAALSEYCDGRPVRVMNSATGAMEVALKIIGIGAGDEVITTPLSWVATANVVLLAGAKPVFVDTDPKTRNIDISKIEAAITPKTKAIFPVDFAGLPFDRDALYAIANRHKLRVIEDAAQSMGANWKGKRIGTTGDLVSISFHANKNMTTTEGGCLILSDPAEVTLCEKLRLQGVVRTPDGEQHVDVAGGKFNMTDVAAVIGLHQLPQLDGFNTRRARLAAHYYKVWDDGLGKYGCELPPDQTPHGNWHMFQVLLPLEHLTITRGDFIAKMHARGIGVGVHYPAIHLFELYRKLGFKPSDFPHTERIGRSIITLPLFPTMTTGDVERVCEAVRAILVAAEK